jgi:hypothetical protein
LEDLKFRAGGDEQWPAEVLSERRGDGRPCLTLNTLPASERQILNEQRQNRPAVKVHPVDDAADIDTAKVIQGVIRHIEVDSNAQTLRTTQPQLLQYAPAGRDGHESSRNTNTPSA